MKLGFIILLFALIYPTTMLADTEHPLTEARLKFKVDDYSFDKPVQLPFLTLNERRQIEKRLPKFEYETLNVIIGSYVKHIPNKGEKTEGLTNRPIGLEYNRNEHTIGVVNFTNSVGIESNSVYYGYTFFDYLFVTTGLATGYGKINPPRRGFYILWGLRYRYKMFDIKVVCNPPLTKDSPITIGIQFAIAIKLK